MSQPLFGLVPAGLPVLTDPAETPSPTSFIYSIPTTAKPFSHIVVFLLPGVALPAGSAAAIYLVTPPDGTSGGAPNSRFLGGIGPGKESAIFKIEAGRNPGENVVIGISVEDAQSVAARIGERGVAGDAGAAGPSNALVPARQRGQQQQTPSTLVLAQRIIKNAFNFLSGFSGTAGPNQVEVVPLRAFENWWQKFESKVRTDPTFLERDTD